MNYTRGPLKEMPSSNCRQTKVLLKDMASVQQLLLDELVPVFTQKDNENFLKPPTVETVKEVVNSSNLYAAPGTDGLPSLLYKECWAVLGNPLTEVMLAIGDGQSLQKSMLT